MKQSKIYEINNHPKFFEFNVQAPKTYKVNSHQGSVKSKEVGGDNMNNDYITRPEFEEHKRHLNSRFDNIETKIDNAKETLNKDIELATKDLKSEINKEKITTTRFWIGISIPTLISIGGIILNIFY